MILLGGKSYIASQGQTLTIFRLCIVGGYLILHPLLNPQTSLPWCGYIQEHRQTSIALCLARCLHHPPEKWRRFCSVLWMKSPPWVTTSLAGHPVDSTIPALRYQNKQVLRHHGEICWDSHTIKTVINTCIVPGEWVCVTSSFSLWLEGNKRTCVLIAGAPSPVTRGRWSVRRELSLYLLQLLASPPINPPGLGPWHLGWGAGSF